MNNKYYDWLFLIISLLLTLALLGVAAILSHNECALRANLLGLNFDFNFLSLVNCRVNVNDMWVPIENYLVGG